MVTRRGVLAGAAGAAGAAPASGGPFAAAALGESLARYIGFGVKASGGEGDTACGAWLEASLAEAGFHTQRQAFEAPYFTPTRAALTTPAGEFALLAQAPVTPATVSGPLAAAGAPAPRGAIVVATLPYARWSTTLAPPVPAIVAQAAQDGAAALLLATTGPTGQAIALNVEAHRRWPLPVAVLAPRDAARLTMGAAATFDVRGEAGMRPAFNVIGTLDRGAKKRIVISTPRSGWTVAAGERGGGVAVWRALARWAPRALAGHDLTMIATSGHEYEYLGGETFLRSALAPAPADTHLWAHLGANVAARDWHEFGARLAPLPSADPQRVLMGAAELVPTLAATFRGIPGLEQPYPASAGASGELASIVSAGFPRAFGIFGVHRYHHVADDDARCVDGALVAPVAARFRDAVARLA